MGRLRQAEPVALAGGLFVFEAALGSIDTMLGKEREQLRLRQLVSKAAVAPEHRCNNAIAD